MPSRTIGNVRNWASVIDDVTLGQAQKAAALPIVHGHVALMPDAHLGIGATVGSVMPTRGAIIPAAVGVDIGCGMSAARTSMTSGDLPDDLERLLRRLSTTVPSGMGKAHAEAVEEWAAFVEAHGWPRGTTLDTAQERKAAAQFGTLGSGNHFLEICLDEEDRVWVMLHSGSRGIGNGLAQRHIAKAKREMREALSTLGDPDLAYFVENTKAFGDYIDDVLWAQAYAAGNRRRMLLAALRLLADHCRRDPDDLDAQVIDCHHNYTARETHDGVELWITRKGAILAREGDLGIIPGSMGARSYIVRGKGNPLAYNSCAHGAGRAMSRNAARKRFTADDLAAAMGDRTWLRQHGRKLVDEIPAAYKDIDQVMKDQSDLVEIVHTLTQVLSYKGT